MIRGERFNTVSHAIGAALALAALAILVVMAARQGDPWKIVSFSIYGATLVLLYAFSTLYHALRGPAKDVFRALDHQAIYLLIAGTYTPLTLVTLHGVLGWWIFGIVWGLAVLGMTLEFLPRKGHRILPVVIYLLMGWLVLAAIRPVLDALPRAGFLWLLAGGGCYTGGVVFYALDKRVRHFHGVWHLFVLAGSLCHFITMLLFVA